MSVENLIKKIDSFIQERNWEQYHNPKDLAVSLSIEANELLELFQWKDKKEVKKMLNDPEKFQEVKDEIADVGIYLLNLSKILDIDFEKSLEKKLQKNKKKYPVEKFKGTNKKYNEL